MCRRGTGIARTKATKAAALILIARVTPGLSYLIPLFLFQWLGMIDADAADHHASGYHRSHRGRRLMIGFFEGLPGELEETALVDGATI